MQRSVIVTGASGGLGGAVTTAMLDAGWRVVAPVRDARARERVERADEIELVQADLTDPDSAAAVIAAAGDDLRALVNLVGGFAAPGRVHETPIEEFEAQLRLNLRPTYLMCAAALPVLVAGGGGAIVCTSARAALRPFAGASGYVTAKAGLLAFVDALDVEYRSEGIRANAVLPSVIDTPTNRAAMPDADHARWVAPAEIARVIAFLCSDGAGVVSGARIPVYGRA